MKISFPTLRRLFVAGLILLGAINANAARQMENLGRGVVAIRTGTSSVFLSWRLLGLDPAGIGFNVYRSANGGAAVKLNGSVLTAGCNYNDTTANLAQANAYYVRPVIGGVEQAASGSFILPANAATEPVVRIPIRNTGGVPHVWVGDLDGDGEYDYVLTREGTRQKVEAYRRDGTFLWATDQGPNSDNTGNNEYEARPSTLASGNWDGVTVYDLDGDGRAEVILKTANGVVFGNGVTMSVSDNNAQFISVLNGMTGAERARIQWPSTYASDGWMGMNFGIGYINGTTPNIIVKGKNRVGMDGFNMIVCAFSFSNGSLTKNWQWNRGTANANDGHQIRMFDIDRNGTDEFCDCGFTLNANGSFRYAIPGVIHGDRNSIGDLNPSRAGIEGFVIQQDNPSGLLYAVYDAATGAIIRNHFGAIEDTARGLAADIDASSPGCEYWSFHGVHRMDNGNTIGTGQPYPNFRIWWDGDLLAENLHDGKVEEWNGGRLLTTWNAAIGGAAGTYRNAPMFYGDILGDWREEIVMTSYDSTQLIVFTTPTPTTTRLYTPAHNPAYRNSMTMKGYQQSHYTDYFLGDGMSTPPAPNISYSGSGPSTVYYKFRNVGTGLYIDGMGRTVNGENCGQYAGNSSYNQQWSIEPSGSFVKLRNRATGLYLDGMGRTTDGSAAGQWDASGSYNQQWAQETVSGNYKYRNRATGLYLDGMGRTANGSDLGQYTGNTSNNQRFVREQL